MRSTNSHIRLPLLALTLATTVTPLFAEPTIIISPQTDRITGNQEILNQQQRNQLKQDQIENAAAAANGPGIRGSTTVDDSKVVVERNTTAIRQAKVYRGPSFAVGEVPAPVSALPASAPSLSYISVVPPQARQYQKHDILTIIVREDSNASSTGKGESNKKQDFDFSLDQFLNLNVSNVQVSSSANPGSLPKIKFSYKNDREKDAMQERTDKASARISATIVDVKPNGTLVIEATKTIKLDKEEQNFKLSGICRAADITADNTLLSTQLADLNFSKSTTGEVRDTIKRGWLNKFLDTFSPF